MVTTVLIIGVVSCICVMIITMIGIKYILSNRSQRHRVFETQSPSLPQWSYIHRERIENSSKV